LKPCELKDISTQGAYLKDRKTNNSIKNALPAVEKID
jgi:hypothetical protein